MISKNCLLIFPAIVLLIGCQQTQPQTKPFENIEFHEKFTETFDVPTSDYFIQRRDNRAEEDDFRYFPGSVSLSEKGTKVMIYRFDPEDPAGPGRGPEIISKKFTHFGTYSARLRIPDITKVQPDVGMVVGYFTYHLDETLGLSEIDFEWLLADPEIIYVGTWTGTEENLQRIGRTINMAQGVIYETSYMSNVAGGTLTGLQSQPETIEAIENYNASARFYTYGFDWYPDRLVWWVLHPTTGKRVILWDYSGSTPHFTGIPTNPTLYRLNYWHTPNWSVVTRPNSIEKPLYPYEVEIDWMSYSPYD